MSFPASLRPCCKAGGSSFAWCKELVVALTMPNNCQLVTLTPGVAVALEQVAYAINKKKNKREKP